MLLTSLVLKIFHNLKIINNKKGLKIIIKKAVKIIIIIKVFNHTVVSLQNEDKTNESTIIHIYCFPS